MDEKCYSPLCGDKDKVKTCDARKCKDRVHKPGLTTADLVGSSGLLVHASPASTALHASGAEGHKCADCSIDDVACPECYAAWWSKRHPNVVRTYPEPSPKTPYTIGVDLAKDRTVIDAVGTDHCQADTERKT